MTVVRIGPAPAGAQWPLAGLDVAALEARGWRPAPFNEFIVKLHSRCNLACDYCYMYEMADQSWLGQPKFMAHDTMTTVAERVAEHVRTHQLPQVYVTLHGGEPLLAGVDRAEFLLRGLRRLLPPQTRLMVGMQTNGVLLGEPELERFRALGVQISVSLDGGEAEHDRHRTYRDGRGSYQEVARALRLLGTERYRHLFAGILCTIDLENDPLSTYQGLKEFAPSQIDFLLPHANWSTPPPGAVDQETRYADWLLAIFRQWYGSDHGRVGVRFFESLLTLLLGGGSHSESMGVGISRFAVIETNGDLEQVDSLKSAFPGAPQLGYNVRDHPLDLALRHPAIAARQIGMDALSDTCRACELVRVCGGGHFVHRYREGTGFRNPSVYCADLQKIITSVGRRVADDLAAARERAGHATVRPEGDHR